MAGQSSPSKRKIAEPDFNSSKIKVVRCSEDILDNINAALLTAEKCMEESDKTSNDSNTLQSKKLIPQLDVNVDEEMLKKTLSDSTQKENNEMAQNNNSSINFETDVTTVSTVHNNTQLNNNLRSTSSNHSRILNVTSTNNTYNSVMSNTDDLVSKGVDSLARLESNILDTAFITIPSVSGKKVDASYKYLTSNDRVKSFIQDGRMFDSGDIVDIINNPYDPAEIDQIVDDEIIYGVRYYLVKWKKWSKGFNTWERFGDLRKSQKHVFEYVLKKKTDVNSYKPINGVHLMLPRKVISKLFDLFKTETGLSLPIISPEDLNGLFNGLDIGARKSQISRKKCLKLYLATIALSGFRQQQLIRIKNWEFDINSLSQNSRIKVENNVDLEGPPDSFVYIRNRVTFGSVTIPDDPPIGCSCKRNCGSSKYCCNEMSGYSSVYDENKCITVDPGCPVFECNKKCKCSAACNNRVVQLGSNISVCIYKTSKCGWGVRTTQFIRKGQFVAQYVGEIITVEESEQRLENNTSCMDYMWNLDFEDGENYKYIIDGSHYANYTYFINHSCSPNLNMYAVWINCLDTNLPELALFAARDISPGEQLTTHYFSRLSNPEMTKKSGIRCQCQMRNCKGYYF